MSSELVAALVGAVAGGIIAVLGGLAQVFIQGWISERGEITCDVAAKLLTFRFRDPTQPGNRSFDSLKDARAFSNEKAASAGWQIAEIRYSFTANFLNTKGTNAAALEYSVRFLKGKRTVATSDPTAASSDGALLAGQAVALPAENATGIEMQGGFSVANAANKAFEADRIEFIVRLSTGKIVGVELERLPLLTNLVINPPTLRRRIRDGGKFGL